MINSNSLQIENRMSITRSEKILMQANAALLGIGTTAGFFVEGLWFASTPVDYGGLGLVLSGAGAAVTISLVGIVSALTAIPIAYLFYRDGMSEAKDLIAEINHETHQQLQIQQDLFYQLLRLRCLYTDEIKFYMNAKRLLKKDFDFEKLLIFVNHQYLKIKHSYYQVCAKPGYPPELSEENGSQTLPQILCDISLASSSSIKDSVFEKLILLSLSENKFKNDLMTCFKKIENPSIAIQKKSIAYGVVSGLTITGVAIGTGWGFGALVLSAGLCAAIPLVGWIVFTAACLGLGLMFGIGMPSRETGSFIKSIQ